MVFKKINCEITIRFKLNFTRDRIYGKERVMNSKLFYKVMSGFYDLLDVIYFRKYETSPRKVVFDTIGKKDNVLDLCTGTATNAIAIAKKNPNAKIVGVDLSKDMLVVARNKVNKENLANVRLYRMDATQMHFKDESFDKLLLSLVLHETDEELAKKIIKEAMRVMKPDGELVVTEWERSDNFIKKILFIPIEILEPKPYKTFVTKDHKKYFKEFGLEQRKLLKLWRIRFLWKSHTYLNFVNLITDYFENH